MTDTSTEAVERLAHSLDLFEFFRKVADVLCALVAERDAALDRVEELETNGQRVAEEFEGDCWGAMRSLLAETHFPWTADDMLDGVTAETAREHISTTLAEIERSERRWRETATSLVAERDAIRAELATRDEIDAGEERIERALLDGGDDGDV